MKRRDFLKLSSLIPFLPVKSVSSKQTENTFIVNGSVSDEKPLLQIDYDKPKDIGVEIQCCLTDEDGISINLSRKDNVCWILHYEDGTYAVEESKLDEDAIKGIVKLIPPICNKNIISYKVHIAFDHGNKGFYTTEPMIL